MSEPGGSGWGRSGHRRVIAAGLVVLGILLGGGAAAWATVAGGNTGYRMATVTRADIGQSLTVVGTVEPVSQASASFQVGGKVETLSATVGEQVSAGQSLGTLDTTALSDSVSSAQSTLAADQAKLAQDESSQASSAAPPSSSTTTTTPSSHGGSTGNQSAIAQDQATLTQDEAKTATDQQQEAADLAAAQRTCGTGAGSGSGGQGAGTTTTTTTTTSTTDPGACTAALATVSKDQQAVSADQATVARDENALAVALGDGSSGSSASSGSSGSPSSPGSSRTTTAHTVALTSPAGSGNTGSGSDRSPGGSGSNNASAASDSPQQIAADQAAIDTAQADLTMAQEALAEGTLTSPINGTVVSVGIHAGDTVSAASSTAVIVIIGTQSYEVVASLSSSQVPSVKVGDTAHVNVDGVDGTLDGTVSQVGPAQSGSSGYSYPVVVALPTSATGLFTGSTANVVVATGGVTDVVAVPTSAVQTIGSRTFVLVLSDGALSTKRITVGVVGDTYTQVRSGLRPGQTVVLADYSEAVPSSNTNTFGGLGGLGGLGGGAFHFSPVGGRDAGGGGSFNKFVGG